MYWHVHMLLHMSNGKDCKSVEKEDYTIREAIDKNSTAVHSELKSRRSRTWYTIPPQSNAEIV